MKKLLIGAGLLLGLSMSNAQAQDTKRLTYADLPIDPITHLVTYSDVVPVAGATKEQLLFRAKEWAARSFRENSRAPQIFDPVAGTYSSRGFVDLLYGTTYSMVLTITAQDGSYKYAINQLFYTYQASSSGALSGAVAESAEHWATYSRKNAYYVDVRVQEVQQFIPQLLASLHESMRAKGLGSY